jgi:hypothetical protein
MSDDETRLTLPTREDDLPATSADGIQLPALAEAEQLALGVLAVLDRLAASIPDLRPPHPKTARRARGARTVNREAVLSIVAMVEATDRFRNIKVLNPEQARKVVQYRDAYRAIAERLNMLLRTVNHTIEAQWAEVVASAMYTYTVANSMAGPRETELLPHLEIIRRHLGRTRGPKRKKKSPEPETPEE